MTMVSQLQSPTLMQTPDANTDPIAQAMGMESISTEVIDQETGEITEVLENDYNYTRRNTRDLIDKGHRALDELINVASQSQHPRAFEVVAGLINALASCNKDLLELAKREKELNAESQTGGVKTVNNNLFVGTTADLQDFVKKLKNG